MDIPSIEKYFQKTKITNERQLILGDFINYLNKDRSGSGRKPLPPGFVGMKMSLMNISEMKSFYEECKESGNFARHWWWSFKKK